MELRQQGVDYTGQLAASQKNKDDEDGQGMKKSGSTSSLAGALAAMAAEQGLGLETRASSEAIDEDEGKAAEDSEEDPDTHPTTTSKKKDALIGGQHSSLIGGQHPSGVEIEGVVPIVRSRSTSTSNPHPPPPPSKEIAEARRRFEVERAAENAELARRMKKTKATLTYLQDQVTEPPYPTLLV